MESGRQMKLVLEDGTALPAAPAVVLHPSAARTAPVVRTWSNGSMAIPDFWRGMAILAIPNLLIVSH